MKRLPRIFAAVATLFAAGAVCVAVSTVTSCDVLRQVAGTYNMTNCKYDFRSLTEVSVAGIDISRGLSPLDTPRILGLLAGGSTGSLPVACTVNLDVQNPGSSEAILGGMEYVLAIDGVDFTSGAVARHLSVAPGATGSLPIPMTFDVAALLRGESRDAVMGVVRNLVAMSGLASVGTDEPSRVTLNIRPSFNVAGQTVASPVFIPVGFSFGGK
ncbi:MAG: hypothetical protein LBU98_03230 [Alistipes sp.]|jgi:hypothetical protein|nr:hypothetical protein [Alistipes sp.]